MLSNRPRPIRAVASVALAALTTVAFSAAPALAKNKTPDPVTQPDAPAASQGSGTYTSEVSVSIPTIETVDSTLSEDTIREILSGNVVDNADELATLTATSITVPEIRVDFTVRPEGGPATAGAFTYRDLVFNDVVDGVAASVTLSGGDSETPEGTLQLGPMTVDNLDIAGLLGFYGLVDLESDAIRPIYSALELSGGTFSAADVSCTMGSISTGQFSARPLDMSLTDFMALASEVEAQGETPDPTSVARLVDYYADMLQAMESDETLFDGFQCTGMTEEQLPLNFSLGTMTIGAFANGRYPAVDVSDLSIKVEGDGMISLGGLTVKGFDLAGPLSALQEAGGNLTPAWLAENYRALIPAFEGMAFNDLLVDVPDSDNPGQRVNFAVGSADLTLGNYFNGIPTTVETTASNLVVDVPANTTDPQLQSLVNMGIDKLDLGYDIGLRWDRDAESIVIERLALSGAEFGTVALSGILGNATEQLFDANPMIAQAAAMGLTVIGINIDVTNAGLAELIFASMAAESGQGEAALRAQISGVAQGTLLALLGGGAEIQALSSAVGTLLNGGTSLSLALSAKDEAGIALPALMAAQADPRALLEQVTIESSAQ